MEFEDPLWNSVENLWTTKNLKVLPQYGRSLVTEGSRRYHLNFASLMLVKLHYLTKVFGGSPRTKIELDFI